MQDFSIVTGNVRKGERGTPCILQGCHSLKSPYCKKHVPPKLSKQGALGKYSPHANVQASSIPYFGLFLKEYGSLRFSKDTLAHFGPGEGAQSICYRKSVSTEAAGSVPLTNKKIHSQGPKMTAEQSNVAASSRSDGKFTLHTT